MIISSILVSKRGLKVMRHIFYVYLSGQWRQILLSLALPFLRKDGGLVHIKGLNFDKTTIIILAKCPVHMFRRMTDASQYP